MNRPCVSCAKTECLEAWCQICGEELLSGAHDLLVGRVVVLAARDGGATLLSAD